MEFKLHSMMLTWDKKKMLMERDKRRFILWYGENEVNDHLRMWLENRSKAHTFTQITSVHPMEFFALKSNLVSIVQEIWSLYYVKNELWPEEHENPSQGHDFGSECCYSLTGQCQTIYSLYRRIINDPRDFYQSMKSLCFSLTDTRGCGWSIC
jgi:hypothetical protein